MNPIPPSDPLGIAASASILETLYVIGAGLFAMFLKTSIASIAILIAGRITQAQHVISPDTRAHLRKTTPAIVTATIATSLMPIITWYVLFGNTLYMGMKPLGLSWSAALTGLAFTLGISGLLMAALGCYKVNNEKLIKHGFRVFIVFILITMLSVSLTLGAPFTCMLLVFAAGAAVLGIMRPRNRVWLLSTGLLTLCAQFALSAARLSAFNESIAPMFYVEDFAIRWQTAPMIFFFIAGALLLGIVGIFIYWTAKPGSSSKP